MEIKPQPLRKIVVEDDRSWSRYWKAIEKWLQFGKSTTLFWTSHCDFQGTRYTSTSRINDVINFFDWVAAMSLCFRMPHYTNVAIVQVSPRIAQKGCQKSSCYLSLAQCIGGIHFHPNFCLKSLHPSRRHGVRGLLRTFPTIGYVFRAVGINLASNWKFLEYLGLILGFPSPTNQRTRSDPLSNVDSILLKSISKL